MTGEAITVEFVGVACAGKTTLSRLLIERLRAAHVSCPELDEVYWWRSVAGVNHPTYPSERVLTPGQRARALSKSVADEPMWHIKWLGNMGCLVALQAVAGCGLRYRGLVKMRGIMELAAHRCHDQVVCWDEGVIALAASALRSRPESEVKAGLRLALTGLRRRWVVVAPPLDLCIKRWRSRYPSGLRRFSDSELMQKLQVTEDLVKWVFESSGLINSQHVCRIDEADTSVAVDRMFEFARPTASMVDVSRSRNRSHG